MAAQAAGPLGAAAIRGLAQDSSGRPLARASVGLEALPGGAVASNSAVLTDSSGRFQFHSLPAGSYQISVQKRGYATVRFGQKQWRQHGTPIVLEEGTDFVAMIRLSRLGAVSGEIADENRVGLAEHQVYAWRVGSRPRLAGAAQTDDRGRYRIAGLEPGGYRIRSGARVLEDGRSLLPTYLGQTTSAHDARTVEVRLDEEDTGLDIEPLPGRLSIIEGTVLAAAAVTVGLFTDTGKRETTADPAGAFRFDQLPPGTYEILAETSGPPPQAAWRRLAVAAERETVQLSLSPAPVISVRCREKQGRAFDPRTVTLFLKPKSLVDDDPRRIQCGESATFSPGEWEVATVTPPGLYVAAILEARRAEGAYEFTLAPGQPLELSLVISTRPATVKGNVTTSDGARAIGAPVFLQASDPELAGRLGGARVVRAGSEGEFRFDGLPPGHFELLSSFSLGAGADPPGWRPGMGKTVVLEEDGEETVDLVLSEPQG